MLNANYFLILRSLVPKLARGPVVVGATCRHTENTWHLVYGSYLLFLFSFRCSLCVRMATWSPDSSIPSWRTKGRGPAEVAYPPMWTFGAIFTRRWMIEKEILNWTTLTGPLIQYFINVETWMWWTLAADRHSILVCHFLSRTGAQPARWLPRILGDQRLPRERTAAAPGLVSARRQFLSTALQLTAVIQFVVRCITVL